MRPWCFDTETEAFRPGLKAPPMACMTWVLGGHKPQIVHWTEARPVFERALLDPNLLIVGQYVAFDMCVCAAMWPDLIPAIFHAYEADRVTDTKLREQLHDIALGTFRGYPDERGVWRKNSYSLDATAYRRAGMQLKKDGWRRRYGEFRDIPLSQWPERARELALLAKARIEAGVKDKDLEAIASGDPQEVIDYPLRDAEATLAVYLAQERTRGPLDPYEDQFRQARASFWLTLCSTWGLRTREDGIQYLEVMTSKEVERLTADLVKEGLVRPDGSRNIKAAKARMLDACGWHQDYDGEKYHYTKLRDGAIPVRKTASGDVTLDRDACKASEDPVLIDYGNRAQLQAVLDKDIPMLRAGIVAPVHTSFDIVASGRSSSSSPNIQNLRRLPGIREAFVPRDGCVFAQADYPGLELRTLAQACIDLLGYSKLAEMLNAGIDPHLAFAAELLKITYEEAKANKKTERVDAARQVGKVFNFGAPGGLGTNRKRDGSDPTLVQFARKTYGIVLTIEQVKEFYDVWIRTLPEMRDYFAHVRRLTDNEKKEARVRQLRSNRIRGGTPYTAACNTYFQGLGADATKAAGFEIAKACYVDTRSPLFGWRTVAYIHDEFLIEGPDDDRAHDAAHELAKVMRDAANKWIPDVPFTDIEPLLMRVWSKEARPLHINGRLVPWEPALGGLIDMAEAIRRAA